MRFVVSVTMSASSLQKIIDLWEKYYSEVNLFKAVLVTPLFASEKVLDIIKYLKENYDSVVYFDSGGYYAQQGKINFKELYRRLLKYYLDPKNQWADYYVLPDYPPTSDDSIKVAELKVKETITASCLTFYEIPEHMRENAIGVIHGKSLDQILFSLDSYRELGITYFGFGSFSTNGKNNSINVLDENSVAFLDYISRYLGLWQKKNSPRLHVFGVSTPPAVYIFNKLGIYSFDSSAWSKSGGYGKIFMPFTRAYNITYQTTRNSSLSLSEFLELKELTGHNCPFCIDIQALSKNRWFRILHNLIVLHETVQMVEKTLDEKEVLEILKFKSPRYYNLAVKLLQGGRLQ